jgi:hypothetical protein
VIVWPILGDCGTKFPEVEVQGKKFNFDLASLLKTAATPPMQGV